MKKNSKFDRNKILRYLKLLQFDPEKHNSLASALKEILESERYVGITLGTVNGIQIDQKIVQEVNEIMEAYEYLKENKEQIFQDNSLFEDYSQKISEVYIIEDENILKVMKRDSKDQEYQCVLEFDCEYHRIYSDYGYLFEYDNNIIKKIYSLQGEIILNIEEGDLLEKVRGNSCRAGAKKLTDHLVSFRFTNSCYDKNKKYLYIIVNCATKEYICTYKGELLQKVFYNDNISACDKDNLFYSVYNGILPEYLLPSKDKYDRSRKSGMFNDYIWVYEKGNTTYYTVSGEKIISTLDGNYSYIQAGEVWDTMTYNIEEYGISCSQDNIVVIGKYNKELKILYGYYDLDKRKEIVSPCSKEPLQWLGCCGIVFCPNLTIVDRNGKKYSVRDDDKLGIFHIYEGTILKIRELSNNYYIATYFQTIYSFREGEQGVKYSYALMKDIFTNPQKLSYTYDKMIICNSSTPSLLVCKKDGYWRRLSLDGKEYNIVGDSVKKNIKSHENKKIPNNIDITPKIESSLANYLLPEVIKNELSRLDETLPCYDDKVDSDNCITKIEEYNQNGVLFLKQKGFPETLLVNEDGKVMFTPDSIPFMDDFGNICIHNYEGSFETLINSDGKILIPLKKDIDFPHNNLYIVKEEDGYTLFDINGNQILGKFENLEWEEKFYVNGYGVVSRTEDKLKLTQNGYVTIADDEKEFFVKKNEELEETLKKLVLFKREINNDSI